MITRVRPNRVVDRVAGEVNEMAVPAFASFRKQIEGLSNLAKTEVGHSKEHRRYVSRFRECNETLKMFNRRVAFAHPAICVDEHYELKHVVMGALPSLLSRFDRFVVEAALPISGAAEPRSDRCASGQRPQLGSAAPAPPRPTHPTRSYRPTPNPKHRPPPRDCTHLGELPDTDHLAGGLGAGANL